MGPTEEFRAEEQNRFNSSFSPSVSPVAFSSINSGVRNGGNKLVGIGEQEKKIMSTFLEEFHFPSRAWTWTYRASLVRTAFWLNHCAVWQGWEGTGASARLPGLGGLWRVMSSTPHFLCLFIFSPSGAMGVLGHFSAVWILVCGFVCGCGLWRWEVACRGLGSFYVPWGRRVHQGGAESVGVSISYSRVDCCLERAIS